MAKLEILQADYKTLSRTVIHLNNEKGSLFFYHALVWTILLKVILMLPLSAEVIKSPFYKIMNPTLCFLCPI